MFEGFEHKTISVDGVAISCVVGGEGAPVLLLHGYPQCKALWARVAPLLSERFTVVCADLRGYGDSGKPKCLEDCSNYSFRAMATDQVGLMRELGFPRFHVIGHDRGGRAAHRMALDYPDAVLSLCVMDIVPTYTMFMKVDRVLASAYWHWYFLSLPAPFPERLIGNDPDFFFETCLVGWGAAKISNFAPDMIDSYRTAWRNPDMIHGSCSDYRAAAAIDLQHDAEDIDTKIACPTLVFFGAEGLMARLFDIPAEWARHCLRMETASLPGGHFFIDQFPVETASALQSFLVRHDE